MESLLSLFDKLQKDPPFVDRQMDASAVRQPRDWRDRQFQQAVTAYRQSVQRDLEWLLNTRRTASAESATAHPFPRNELQHSVFYYGLPGFAYVSLSPDAPLVDVQRLAKEIEDTIRRFEPRILDPKVDIEQMPGMQREIRFCVSGKLRMKPEPEFVQYRTLLDIDRHSFHVETPGDRHA